MQYPPQRDRSLLDLGTLPYVAREITQLDAVIRMFKAELKGANVGYREPDERLNGHALSRDRSNSHRQAGTRGLLSRVPASLFGSTGTRARDFV